jgi:hypothetical protein
MMKAIFFFYAFFFALGGIILSCKREISCEGCKEGNQPPIAIAGSDQNITLPTDSIVLDGRNSSDPDGTISEWLWTKISGPASFDIRNSSNTKTAVKNLVNGVYQFELKVTDDKNLSATDTMQVIVNDLSQPNHPPVASAGADHTITLPTNTITVDGSGSTDPDINITAYQWTKISGSSSFSISNTNAVQTQISNLIEGVYQFELKVTDAGGLFSKDTMQITVVAGVSPIVCGSNRPTFNAQLIPVGTLSQNRPFLSVASVGNKILFAGGSQWPIPPYATTRVEIYDIPTQIWSTAELSAPRWNIATVTAGTKVFFAGGMYYDDGDNGFSTDVVDIYDAATNQWSTAQLSVARHSIAAATVGDKVFFAGGQTGDYINMSDKIDVYNLTTNSWSTTTLSQPRQYITAVTANNKIYFAGGQSGYNILPNSMLEAVASNRIDIYDNSSNSWSIGSLAEARYLLAGINHGNKIYWAGGWKTNPTTLAIDNFSCIVEINDLSTQNTSITYLNQPRSYFVNGGQNAVAKNDRIVFFNGSRYLYSLDPNKNKFDIYDATNNSWYVGLLPLTIEGASIISVNNTIYVAGGSVNGVLSNQVWKLEF